MSAHSDLRTELDRLESIQIQLAGISARDDEARTKALIDLRRQLATQTARVSELGEKYFSQDDALAREYRKQLSEMRAHTASHQANWSAVRLSETDKGYAESLRAVHASGTKFIAWMRNNLARIKE